MSIKILFIVLITFFTIYTNAQTKGYVENDTLITWSENRKLRWEDFKSKNDTTIINKKHSAETSYNIYLFPKRLLSTEYYRLNVVPIFYKNTSWSNTKSIGVLKHEQIHFDIAEIFARKTRKQFLHMRGKDITNVYEYVEVARLKREECSEYQKLYDIETNHSVLSVKQIEWEKKVKKELNDLNEYKYMSSFEDLFN